MERSSDRKCNSSSNEEGGGEEDAVEEVEEEVGGSTHWIFLAREEKLSGWGRLGILGSPESDTPKNEAEDGVLKSLGVSSPWEFFVLFL